MTTKKKIQIGIGEVVRRWPIATPTNKLARYATLVDVVNCRSPQIGSVYISIGFSIDFVPTHDFLVRDGYWSKLFDYTSAAERLALLSGERIRHGKQKQQGEEHDDAAAPADAAADLDTVRGAP